MTDKAQGRSDRISLYYGSEDAWDLAVALVDAEDALKEAQADAEYFEEWATANGKRLNATLAQRDEYRDALAEVADYDEWEISAVGQSEPVRLVVTDVRPRAAAERDRYRLAWLSARRRAADEGNYALEALELQDERIRQLTSDRTEMSRLYLAKAAETVRLTADRDAWQRGHETAESQLVYERRENARLRAELADLREAIHEES